MGPQCVEVSTYELFDWLLRTHCSVNVPKVAWISEIMRFLIIFPAFQMDPQCVEVSTYELFDWFLRTYSSVTVAKVAWISEIMRFLIICLYSSYVWSYNPILNFTAKESLADLVRWSE
jgi:hypothetical protein|uniref:Uncharacterized protein n=1 Tax=Zea mays TaxID=4577 RepID=C0PEX0_MAIZE|nr:unknown [Zea mays]